MLHKSKTYLMAKVEAILPIAKSINKEKRSGWYQWKNAKQE